MTAALAIRSARVALPRAVGPATVIIRDGVIAAIAGYDDDGGADAVDLGDVALLPGLVDAAVHAGPPGQPLAEAFAAVTAAALAGGVTTICDMPLPATPLTASAAALQAKLAASAGQCAVDVAFWGGAAAGSEAQAGPLLAAGAIGVACWLCDPGVAGFGALDPAGLRAVMTAAAAAGAPVAVHAEDPGELAAPAGESYDAFAASRPPVAERRAVETVIRAAAATGAQAHIAPLAAGEVAALIGAAQVAGVAVSAQACPHHLFFAAEEVPAGRAGFRCCPPVRYAPNREALWRALEDGVIAAVASGHWPGPRQAPPPGGDVVSPGGITPVQLSLPAVWSVARRRGRTLSEVTRWMGQFPASLAGLAGRKGALVPGADADLVAFDPDAVAEVSAATAGHPAIACPYEGRTLTGVVLRTWLRGTEVSPDGPRRGRAVRRGGSELTP